MSVSSIRRSRYGRRIVPLGAAAFAAVLLATGCSSGSSAATAEVDPAQVDAATAFVAPYFNPPTTIPVSEKVTSLPPPGGTIAFINCNQPICEVARNAGADAAAAIGWKSLGLAFDTTPEDILEKVNFAIDQNVDAIFVGGVPRSTYDEATKRATEKGIPIVAGQIDDEVAPPLIAVSGGVPIYTSMGEILGNYVISDSKGKANALVFELAEFPISMVFTDKISETITDKCSSCQSEVVTTSASDVGTKLPGVIVSELQRNPDVNYVVLGDGFQSAGVPAALREAVLADRGKIVGGGASEQSLADIKDGSQYAYLQFSARFFSWDAMDIVIRNAVGDPQVPATEQPLQILTKENTANESADDVLFNLPRDLSTQYKTLWGVS